MLNRARQSLNSLRRWYLDWRQQRFEARAFKDYSASERTMTGPGYTIYKVRELQRILADQALQETFGRGRPLPPGFGIGVDERIVEYPWVLSRLPMGAGRVLDAGATLNYDWIARMPALNNKAVVVYNLEPEHTVPSAKYSYVYGDLRDTILRDASFDAIVCLSTLEHVGMDNTRFYTADPRYREAQPTAYRQVMREFRRLLAPGGRLLLTVPYGRYMHLGWLQQFDARILADAVDSFAGTVKETAYYAYGRDGWSSVDAAACADAEYLFDSGEVPGRPLRAAACALACVHLQRPSDEPARESERSPPETRE